MVVVERNGTVHVYKREIHVAKAFSSEEGCAKALYEAIVEARDRYVG